MNSSIEKLIRADQLIIDCKKEAKALKANTPNQSLMICQNIIAKQKGYNNWHTLYSKIKEKYTTGFNPLEAFIIDCFINGISRIRIDFKDDTEPEIEIIDENGFRSVKRFNNTLISLSDFLKKYTAFKEFKDPVQTETESFNFSNGKKVIGSINYTIIPIYPHGTHVSLNFKLFTTKIHSLLDLGFTPEQVKALLETKRNGIMLFSGVAGSGRSTSIKSFIKELSSKNFLTIEEFSTNKFYHIDLIKYKEGMLKCVEKKVDILKISELRCSSTATIVNDTVKEGQFIVASIHASSTSGTLRRLDHIPAKDLNVTRIVYQRLLPVLCPHCKKTSYFDEVQNNFIDKIKTKYPDINSDGICFIGRGCKHCKEGISKRTVCAEIVDIEGKNRHIFETEGPNTFEKHLKDKTKDKIMSLNVEEQTHYNVALKKMFNGEISPNDIERYYKPF